MPRNLGHSKMPLNHKDTAALDKIFSGLDGEFVNQIETISSYYAVAPLDRWEEKGWVRGGCLSGCHNSKV